MASRSIAPDTQLSYSSASRLLSNQNSPPVKTCGERRPVGRADIRENIPDPDDLWGLVGKYPTNENLQEILNKGVEERAIPPERAKFRHGTSAVDKNELTARVLAYKRTRELALDFLRDYKLPRSNNKLMTGLEELRDFYLQFCENGVKYPADIDDSPEIQEAAMITYIEPVKQLETRKKNTLTVSKRLYEKLNDAITKGDNSKERLIAIYTTIKLFSELNTDDLVDAVYMLTSNYS